MHHHQVFLSYSNIILSKGGKTAGNHRSIFQLSPCHQVSDL